MDVTFHALLLIASSLFSAEREFGVPEDPFGKKHTVHFVIRDGDVDVWGMMDCSITTFNFDTKDLNARQITAIAYPATLNTGVYLRDYNLKGHDYFNVACYPTIRLSSNSFQQNSKDELIGWFDLIINGRKKEIAIPITLFHEDEFTIYSAIFEINRLDFDLGIKSDKLDEKVKIIIELKM
jgi:polyisoprenoid-binding protein YceI